MRKPVLIFLLLAYGVSWSISEIGFRLLPANKTNYTMIASAFMFGPALAALITRRFVQGRDWGSLGPYFARNRHLLWAIAIPLLFAALHPMLTMLLPGMSLNLEAASLASSILSQVPEAQRELAGAQLHAFGEWLPLVFIAQILIGGLIAGLTINAIAAFGEELGWRGFLHQEWRDWSLWKRAAVTGVFWGLWHTPLLLRGHNFPDNPEWGVLMMVLFCVALSPLFEFVRERAGSVLAASWMHGVLNATGGVVLFVNGPDLLRGPAGLAGILTLLLMNAVLFRHLRRRP